MAKLLLAGQQHSTCRVVGGRNRGLLDLQLGLCFVGMNFRGPGCIGKNLFRLTKEDFEVSHLNNQN